MRLEELQRVFAYCTRPDAPDLYRKLYAERGAPNSMDSWADWYALPVLEREYRSAIPFAQRCFAPLQRTSAIMVTSGTSGKPPLFSPVGRADGFGFMLAHWDFNAPFLCSTVQYPRIAFALAHARIPAQALITDPQHLDATARLAASAGVRAIIMHAMQARGLGEALSRQNVNDAIDVIFCGGSSSMSAFTYLRRTFPNARIFFHYGGSDIETSPIGIPCKALERTEDAPHYHANEHVHLDIVDAGGNPVEPIGGAEGDLLVTEWTGENAASPLIRYKNGDRVRVIDTECRGHGRAFTVLGRSETDFVKIPGGVLRVDEIERVLKNIGRDVEYQMHYAEVDTAHGLKLRAALSLDLPDGEDWDGLAHEIASKLHVGPAATYADMVSKGYFLALECKPLCIDRRAGKLKRLVKD